MRKALASIKAMALMAFAIGGLQFLESCNPDEGEGMEVIASFQTETSADNFLEVTFKNFSQNAVSYSWDFGDGNTNTEMSPTHTYAAAGKYMVELTATGEDGTTNSKTEEVSVVDPNETLAALTGTVSKEWILLREGVALGIGEAPNNTGWWSFGGVTPLGDRPCILDDTYTFFADGTFGFESNNTFFLDAEANGGWNDDLGEGCHEENEPGVWTGSDSQDRSDFANGGDYTFTLENDELTIDGSGAYIGLPVKTDHGDNSMPEATKTFQVLNLYDGDGIDSLTIALVAADNSAWTFYLVHYENEADKPDIPSAKPTASFSFAKKDFTVDFTNSSSNATNYTWDFGDGGSSVEENPSHTYTSEGTYTVKLTASDDNGNSDETTQEVTISQAQFTADVLSSTDGRVWKLAPIAAALKVGPGRGDGSWWGNSEGDVTGRDCLFDDEFIFSDNGTFGYDAKGQVYAEAYLGVAEGCTDESAIGSPWDAYTTNNGHSFSVDMTGDYPTITLSGTGAFIGIPKPTNGSEYPADASGTPVSQRVYEVQDYIVTDDAETLVIGIDYSADQDASSFWTFTITSEK